MAPCPCPLLQMFWICSPCTISLTFVLFFGTAKWPWVRPIYDGMTVAQEKIVLEEWMVACDDFPISASRKAMIELIRPDEEAGDLDRNVAELINVCIENPHVRSLELQV